MFASDKWTTPGGKIVTITFIKHASLMLSFSNETGEDIIIQIDPLSEYADYTKFPKANYILVTHEHFDHLDKEAIASASEFNKTRIILNPNGKKALESKSESEINKLTANISVIKNFDTLQLAPDIKVTALPAYNKAADKQKYHPQGGGRDNGYLLNLDGLKIYISGDTEDIDEMKELENEHIDIAFLAVNQPYTMTPAQAINAIQMIKPKIFYPYHFGETHFDENFFTTLETKGIKVYLRELQ